MCGIQTLVHIHSPIERGIFVYTLSMAKNLRIYFVDVREGVRFMHTSPPFSPAYTHRWTLPHMGILLYTAVRRPPNVPYDVYIILYQHLYKYSTRKYQLVINAVVTSYHQRYPIHMPRSVCSYICWNILDCCFICHAAR